MRTNVTEYLQFFVPQFGILIKGIVAEKEVSLAEESSWTLLYVIVSAFQVEVGHKSITEDSLSSGKK